MTAAATEPSAPARIPLALQAEAAARELTWRYRVYAGRVKAGKMTEAERDREIALMRAIRDTLRLFAEHEDAIRAVVRAGIERKRLIAEAEGLAEVPAVAAVLDAFPGAEIVGISDAPGDADEITHEAAP